MFAVKAPVDCVPDVAFVPLHPPLALHDVALLLDHESVDDAPDAMLVGEAFNVTVGTGLTVTVADRLVAPPVPVQVNVNVELALSGPLACVPEVALLPDHAPLAVHAVALLLDHESVEEPPEATLVGEALKITVGTGLTVTVAD